MENQVVEAIRLLKEILNWWDEWNNNGCPTEMEDPPIEEIRSLLKMID